MISPDTSPEEPPDSEPPGNIVPVGSVRRSWEALYRYAAAEEFSGYDPYDALNARLPWKHMGKWIPIFATQLHKRNPINLRPLLGIGKARNPKGIGLFLSALCMRYRQQRDETLEQAIRALYNWLLDNASPGYSGPCWGYPFSWYSPARIVPAGTPSLVSTASVSRGLFEYHKTFADDETPAILRRICDFVLNDVAVTETDDGMCFSYTPVVKECCYNASLMGAEILARAHALNGGEELRQKVERAAAFVVSKQKLDGRWNYSFDLSNRRERRQVDFHQGFVLVSLADIIRDARLEDDCCRQAIATGAAFYRHAQFFENGRAKWRLPHTSPADIHHQAQGIITFTRLADLDPDYLPFATRIADYTIRQMQDGKGYFYYRKYRIFTNKISYMRWGQAWMLYALGCLLERLESKSR